MSKLGLHVHSWNKPIFDYCKNVGAAVIKSLDHNPMYVNEVKKAQPKAILLARYYVGYQLLDDPIRRADEFTDQLLRAIKGCNYDAAEGYNEWDGDLQYHRGSDAGLEIWKRYADFEARRSQRLRAEGLRSAVGGCSVGTPPEHWFSAFRPALEEGDFLHLHEYSAPRMWDHVNWHCLKYRFVYKYLEDHGLPLLPLIISECGIDGGVIQRPKQGWRKFGLTPQQYMEDWKWIDGEWRKDWYVVGGCAFDCGGGGGLGWPSFNMDPEMLPLWARYAGEQGITYWEPKGEEMDEDTIKALDVSEYSGQIKDEQWKAAYDGGYRLAIVQAWGGGPVPGGKNAYCEQQLAGARKAGMMTAIYFHLPCDTTTQTHLLLKAVKEAAEDEYKHVKLVAVDIEDKELRPLHPTDARGRLVDAISNVGDRQVLIYTSRYMWQKVMGDITGFERYALWDAKFDEVAELDKNWVPYGGWKQRAVKQYKGTTFAPGRILADLNVASPERLGLPISSEEELKRRIKELETEVAGLAKEREDDRAAMVAARNTLSARLD